MANWFGAHYNQEVRFSSAGPITSKINQRPNYYYYYLLCLYEEFLSEMQRNDFNNRFTVNFN